MTRAQSETARCLTYVAPGRAEIRFVDASLAGEGKLVAATGLFSGISRGTESLVFGGLVPESEHERMRAPFQRGHFPFPVGYGYAWVGRRTDNDAPVFGLFPHQDQIMAPEDAMVPLPQGLDPRRAVLGANMETALNVVWDAGIGPGDRVAIVGGGILGLLIAGIASKIPAALVTVVDVIGERAQAAAELGAAFALPSDAPADQDIVIHTSASEGGVATALACAGVESTVVEASWFGTKAPSVPLGGAFHSRRLTLRSSQVGMVSPTRRVRFSYRRRLETALGLLVDEKYDALVTDEVAFEDLPARLPDILGDTRDGLATAVSYV